MTDVQHLNESQILDGYKTGQLTGLCKAEFCYYLPLRVTGTGWTPRQDGKGDVYLIDRNKSKFMTKEFLEQCARLPLTKEHPKDGDLLNPKSFNKTLIVGNTIHSYIDGDDIWAIGKVFDEDIIKHLKDKYKSTSPGVLSADDTIIEGIYTEDPKEINHLAFVSKGHWDMVSDTSMKVDEAKSIKGELMEATVERTEELQVLNAKAFDAINDTLKMSNDLVKSAMESLTRSRKLDEEEAPKEEAKEEAPKEEEKKEDEAADETVIDAEPAAAPTAPIADEEPAAFEVAAVDSHHQQPSPEIDFEEITDECEVREDAAREDLLVKMRALCDSVNPSMGVKMPAHKGRETTRSLIARFLDINRRYVPAKYGKLCDNVSFLDVDESLMHAIYNDMVDVICDIDEATPRAAARRGQFVDTNKGYAVDTSF